MLLSFITREGEYNAQQWLNQNWETYLVLENNVTAGQINAAMNEIAVDKMGAELKQYLDMTFDDFQKAGNSFNYFLQPLGDIHLRSDNYGGFEPEADITYVYIFTAIAIQAVGPAATPDQVRSTATFQEVAAPTADQRIVAAIGDDRVVPGSAIDGGIAIDSRYFAMVLRATLMPLLTKVLAILLSLSGD